MRTRRPPISVLRVLLLLGALSLAVVSIASAVGGSSATSVALEAPTAAAPIPASQGGGFYIADMRANLVLKVDGAGFVTTVAGTGTAGSGGDGGPATKAELASPMDAVPTAGGGILIADSALFSVGGTPTIRKVSASGTIATVAGGASKAEAESCPGSTDEFGNGCQATHAVLSDPTAAVPLAGGGFLIAEWGNNDVREVNAAGVITRVAGSDVSNPILCSEHKDEIGDGCPAVAASKHGVIIQGPTAAIPFNIEGAAVSTPGSGFLVTEEQGCRVRYVNGSGVISTVAGIATATNSCREAGEAAPPATGTATALKLELPTDARPTAEAGVFLIADGQSCTIYSVNMTTNKYTTFAQDPGCSAHTGSGFGTSAAIPAAAGGAIVADSNSSLVDSLSSAGALSVVAGGGTAGRPPDGTPGGTATTTTTSTTTTPTTTVTPVPQGATTPAPSCRFTARSGVIPLTTHKRKKGSKTAPQPKSTLAVTFVCDQGARVRLAGSITEVLGRGRKTTRKSFALSPRSLIVSANGANATTLLVPAAALNALRHKASGSATVTLTAANAAGASTASTKIARLSTQK